VAGGDVGVLGGSETGGAVEALGALVGVVAALVGEVTPEPDLEPVAGVRPVPGIAVLPLVWITGWVTPGTAWART
jgi:hypothetical protein